MNLSDSAINNRNSCPRKFLFANKIAWHTGKPIKRKAFELKNMLNFQMWQGRVVDKAIEEYIIPKLQRKQFINYEDIAEKAITMAKRQFEFSKIQEYKYATKSSVGNDYCILDIHELSKPYEQKDLDKVYENIRQSILNFPEIMMPKGGSLEEFLKRSGTLIPNVDGWMNFKFQGANVKAQIDLVFQLKNSAVVIDWKVSDSDLLDASKQLTTYGLAVYKHLKKSENHLSKKTWKYENIYLLEINLLRKEVKSYEFNTEIANKALDDINLSHQDLMLTIDGRKWDKIDLSEIPRTDNGNTCNFCNFRTLCAFLITNNYQYDEEDYNQYLRDTEFA